MGPGAVPLKVQAASLVPLSREMMVFWAVSVNSFMLGAVLGAVRVVMEIGAPGMPMLTAVGTPGPEGSCGVVRKLVLGAVTVFPFAPKETTAPAISRTAIITRNVPNILLPRPIFPDASRV